MKTVLIVFILALSVCAMPSHELSCPDFDNPPVSPAPRVEFQVQHRFYDKVNDKPFDTFFGVVYGANINLGLSYRVWEWLKVSGRYATEKGDYSATGTLSRSVFSEMLSGSAAFSYFSFQDIIGGARTQNLFYNLTAKGNVWDNTITPLVTLGYNGNYRSFGLGLGLSLGMHWDREMLESTNIFGEIFPYSSKNLNTLLGHPEKSYAFGIGIKTWGHEFQILAGNSWNIGSREMMLGAPGTDVHWGFNLIRVFGEVK